MNLIRPLRIAVVMIFMLFLSSCQGDGARPEGRVNGSVISSKSVEAQKPSPPAFTASDILKTLGPPAPLGFDMYAVRVGTSKSAKKRLFVLGADPMERIRISFSLFVLKGEGRVILIDTGTVNRNKIRQWKMEDYRSPEKGLALLGITADQVTDIIITHRHWITSVDCRCLAEQKCG